MNYITVLPDFLAMQKMSFCWFIAHGLSEELVLFSKIYDFSRNTQYVIFGQEFKLLESEYRKTTAKKFGKNYEAQIMLPIQIRNKKFNSIKHRRQFPIINLPLMTPSATFIINGCERVIVSQIIRSPGVYFDKNKIQRQTKRIKRKLSGDMIQLASFLPFNEPQITDTQLFFPTPLEIIKNKKKKTISRWSNISIYQYSKNYLQNKEKKNYYYFLKSFKFYRIISKTCDDKRKKKLIHIFFKWLKTNIDFHDFHELEKRKKSVYLLNYFNILVKFLLKYEILQSKLIQREQDAKSVKYKNHRLLNDKQLLEDSYFNLCQSYEQIILKSQETAQIKLNYNLIIITNSLNRSIRLIKNFDFLKCKSLELKHQVNDISKFFSDKLTKSTLYFSTGLKEQLKGTYELKSGIIVSDKIHKYLKTKKYLVQLKNNHQIKNNYYKKYQENIFYTATIIPEFGSWIRVGFQRNTKLNLYQFPIKNKEDEIIIQIDKINQIPVIQLLKEIGLTDLEIYSNLDHADFFYFTKPLLINSINLEQPLLRFSLTSDYFKNISKFSLIFDPLYYRLGQVGRLKINNRLNIKIAKRIQTLTYEDLFAITDQLISLSVSKNPGDDIDHLKNRRVRSVGELLQNLFRIAFQKVVRKIRNQTNKLKSSRLSNFNIIASTIREFFSSSQLSQYLDQTNPLSSLTHRRRISALGPGGLDRDRISFNIRDIHPSHYGRICPIETPEGKNVGLIASLTTCGRVNKLGFLETPFWRVLNGKIIKTKTPIYLTADIEDLYKIAPADISTNQENYLTKNLIPVRYKQDFVNVSPSEVDFIAISTIQVVSVAASLIPFFEHDDANRALMGSNMQRQSVPLILPQKPIVGTGLEHQIARDSQMVEIARKSGRVHSVTSEYIKILEKNPHGIYRHVLQKYKRSNQETCINQRPIVWKGEKIKTGQMICDGPGIITNELALGQNVLVAYAPWHGYNFEDAILINERLVYEDIFTSIHLERYDIDIEYTEEIYEETTKNIPNLTELEIRQLNDDGIVTVGTFLKPGDILVGKIITNDDSEQLPESKLLRAIFGVKAKGVTDTSYRMPSGEYGRVIETVTFNRDSKLGYKFEKIHVFIAKIRKIKVGDKIAGRHGNKGIISRILPRQDMPFLPDGTPIDIILNPLGVPSRMNVGQLYECLLGLAGDKLNRRFKILPFDEMYGAEISRILINKKLRQASIVKDEAWIFNPYAPGKMVLIDGRTGKEFENPITVGNAYMLKLIHLVDDKMHSRANGPYSLVTQQPLGGKAQEGGQRFGEMEVWALEGFGAAFTLKELLTIKSDDMEGRNETVTAIIKGQPIPTSGIPESFKVLLQELRSIGLDMNTYKIDKFSSKQNYDNEINLLEHYNPLAKTFSSTSNINDISF